MANKIFNFSGKTAGDAAKLATEAARFVAEQSGLGTEVSVRADGDKVIVETKPVRLPFQEEEG
jgi:hypothetical protein